ncbi:uncharacterized protein EV154DRAFT_489089 [Mucor mucedo]|uniref:uncharacterized protein n=1 Tax=Mucor mucedo TaxID=29922 RepID=UPI0022203AD1|nr:uncharacterized protein EV154DRAFT_489089 [Mucor mucedo]KAI7863249.1 hypothetical protein EV154DRAFT_489089 [Mucor mucedo]
MNIQPYCPILVPVTVAVTIETNETVIQESVSKHGVKWNFDKHQDVPTGNLNGRQRKPAYMSLENTITCWCCPRRRFWPGMQFAEEKQEDRMPSYSEGRLYAM